MFQSNGPPIDQLVKVDPVDWPSLRDLYRRDWPENMMGYQTVDNFIRWRKQRPDIKHVTIYSLNGDWSDGTFVCIHRYELFINSLNPSNDRLRTAVALFDWSVGPSCSVILEKHRSIIHQIISDRQLKLVYEDVSLVYYLTREKAAMVDVKCPLGITLGPLRTEHAKKIDSLWAHQHDGSLYYIRQLIELSPNVGAFDSTGKLVAWCLTTQSGQLGLLQVDEDCLKQGLGSLVCRALISRLGQMSLDASACVAADNIASMRIFQRLGFVEMAPIFWMRTYPTVATKWVDEHVKCRFKL